MSKLMTMEEWKKQATTKQTAPMDMNVFEPMLNGKPLEFEDRGITYSVPIGLDVKMIVESLAKLVNDNINETDKSVNDSKKLLAVKFAHKYCELHKNDESKVNDSGGNK
ncbi:hypothetical protein LDJ81_03495 [Lentilactobacillus parabuchneri]|uniref:hypothetical protein n=1 Tax=Lentilactobacillus parabuchneri TaxID=152331 RepID=UPI002236B959|nr:hypothetical protein [Lentilactobacillus parabuchneri]MCW4398096.1 hypothetical protein [Lentilactobacillus parabuchneri]